jgi:predicted transcriptional regulator
VVPADLTVEEALREFFVPLGYHSFPVVAGSEVVGLLSIERVEEVSASRRSETTAGEAADRDPSLIVGEDVTVEELAGSGGFTREGRVIVICRDGEIGLISATAIDRAMRASRLLPAPGVESVAATDESRVRTRNDLRRV